MFSLHLFRAINVTTFAYKISCWLLGIKHFANGNPLIRIYNSIQISTEFSFEPSNDLHKRV